ncbi:MAG: hypothetical protein U5L75_02815 [Candidatus Campbellbacteria bacterium]|nr:hypothetical protein [Candidatus Campbellbacteria bacterium]
MQRVPTLYGFSIIVLVLVLMVLNHFIYLGILESSIDEVEDNANDRNEQEQVEPTPADDDDESAVESEILEEDTTQDQ